ncbi:MAG: hypothetical protein ACOY7U_03290 [Acidobacteriota bacterium]|jgi:hypothetical protein|uniref:Response regulatory domain-containing protein n=1 Tax=Thermoanaerobaculum aquaticum TaxID=1312852 RepID=A0A062XUM8_9BACT|nr:hypothetical protein [Thermoanaerobaculum aquaticum]KDA53079.1 hypothetical protein EG19_08160 [Thermoanaerobaculum aquaticum]BCW93668.1 MAG: hypothetical protein KatS3mg007_1562 [Thermoanaerobaculum sp.]
MRRVVLVSGNQAQAYQGALAASGFEAVTVPSYRQARMEVEAGAVAVVVCPEAPAWGGPDAQPLLAMPAALRRGCLLVLVNPGAQTGDGWRAFLANVDLLVAAADAPRLGELLRAALAAKKQLVGLLDPEAANRLSG